MTNNLTRLLELVNKSDEFNKRMDELTYRSEAEDCPRCYREGYDTANTRAKVLGEIIQKLIEQRDCLIHNNTHTYDGEKKQISLCNDELNSIATRYFEGER